MNCTWDLLETLTSFLICQCLWKQAKDAGTFCPAIKKSHSWDSNSKCLEKKHTSRPRSQQRLSCCPPLLLPLSCTHTPPSPMGNTERCDSCPGKQAPHPPTRHGHHACGYLPGTLAGGIFLPKSPTFHCQCCLWCGGAPQTISKRLGFHGDIN